MKKLLLVAGLAFFGLTAQAQEQSKGLQGAWFATSQFGYQQTKTGDDKATNLSVIPIVGTFVTPSVAVGAGVGIMNIKSETGSTTNANTNLVVVEPLVRKYWGLGGKFFFFGQASLPMTFSKDKISDDKTTSVGLDVAPGFDFIVSKWMTVETSFSLFNVNSTTYKPNGGDSTSNFNLNFNPFDLNPGTRSVGGLRVGVKFLF